MSKRDQFLEDESPQEPDAGPSSFFPESGPGLAKEVKIGLAVLLGLLTIFGAVVVKKMRRPADPPAVADDHGAKPDDRAGDKSGPKTPLSGGPGAKPAEPTFVAGKPASSSFSAGAPKWNPAGDINRPKDPGSDSRSASPPPSFMPRAGGLTNGPSSDQPPRPSGMEKAASPSPQFNDVVNANSSRSGDSAFDPFPKQPSSPGLGNSAPMVQASNAPGSSAVVSSNNGGLGPERHPRASSSFASSGTTLATRDITDLSEPGPRTMTPSPGAGAAMVGDPRFGSSRASSPDSRLPPATASIVSPTPGTYRPSSEPFAASSQVGAAPGNFGRPDMASGPRSFDNSSARRADGTYVVQPTDSYWTISKQVYGTGAYFRALAEHNRSKFPDENRLTVGDVVSTPGAADLERSYPNLCPKLDSPQSSPDRALVSNVSVRGPGGARVYVVQEGDNLFNIAKYELNNATRWVEIYELNRDLLGSQVDRLKPGMRLTLPDGSGPAPRTAGRDSGVRR